MNVSYDRVCRLCLSSRGELLAIFPTTSSDGSGPPALASKIKACVSLQINENDELPTKICRKCLDNVNNWHIFKKICERTQIKLLALTKRDNNLLEEVTIKNEPLSDEAYDDGVVIDGSYPDYEQNATSSNKLQPEGPPILASLGLTPRSDKKCVDPRLDWQRVHAILELIQEDEVIDSLQSAEEYDATQYSDHDSDTDAEMLPEIDDNYLNCKHGYLTKGSRFLSKTPLLSYSETSGRKKEIFKLKQRKHDMIQPCPQIKHAWQLIFSDDILEHIANSTNSYIKSHNVKSTSVKELKVFIGILYLHGLTRSVYQKRSDLWDDPTGLKPVVNSMSIERFTYLLQNIRFDSEHGENIDCQMMKSMRKVFEMFAMNCRTAKDVEISAVIDEIMIPVYGPCPFRYMVKNKKIDNGMKLVVLVDPSSFYVNNLKLITDIYCSPMDIVKNLVQHLTGSGKTIIMDSWYNSIPLINILRIDYQLHGIGALNPNHEMIPPMFLSKHRLAKTFMTAFIDDNITLTSYATANSKVINTVSSHPKHYKKGHKTTSAAFYKQNQPAVEVLNVLLNYYTTQQFSNSWILGLFFTLLDIASINAQVIWMSQNTDKVFQRRVFIKELALSLIEEGTIGIENSIQSHVVTKRKLCDKLPPGNVRRRCYICSRSGNRDRKSRNMCIKCHHFVCKQHVALTCVLCDRK